MTTCKHCSGPVVDEKGKPIGGGAVNCSPCSRALSHKPTSARSTPTLDRVADALGNGATTVLQIARVTQARPQRVRESIGRLVVAGRAEKYAVADGCGCWRLVG